MKTKYNKFVLLAQAKRTDNEFGNLTKHESLTNLEVCTADQGKDVENKLVCEDVTVSKTISTDESMTIRTIYSRNILKVKLPDQGEAAKELCWTGDKNSQR